MAAEQDLAGSIRGRLAHQKLERHVRFCECLVFMKLWGERTNCHSPDRSTALRSRTLRL